MNAISGHNTEKNTANFFGHSTEKSNANNTKHPKKSARKSNGKKKGENNRKNGNHYLCWAFIEAANFAIRYNEVIKKYYQRKMKRSNQIIAIKTVAAKLSKACFFMLRDKVKFDIKIFNG